MNHRLVQTRDQLARDILDSDSIGQLVRNGRPVYYYYDCFGDGAMFEGKSREDVALKVAAAKFPAPQEG